MCAFSPSCRLLSFPPLLDYSRRLVNSKHNQTLWSVSLWSGTESISWGVLRWQSPITFCVQVFTALELFHFIIPLKLPPSKTNRQQRLQPQQQHGRPCHPCIAGGGKGSFQAAVNSSFCLGKRFMPIQTTGAVSFFSHLSEKGPGRHSAPLSYVCHNYSVGQLSPSLIKR